MAVTHLSFSPSDSLVGVFISAFGEDNHINKGKGKEKEKGELNIHVVQRR